MAGSSLLALIDDIATVLDDVAILSKVAAKKTAGVLGDDLALNAEQVSGVRAEREIPVVWAVAKGSFKNKLILVPAALAISAVIPWLILPLLMLGGAYLCFEGFEKVAHHFLHKDEDNAQKEAIMDALKDPNLDMVEFEKNKIKGAIRTDFILSAEIIVIALGTVKDAAFGMQVAVVSGIAAVMTVGVYGLVAGIVKLDDAGFYLIKEKTDGFVGKFKRMLGRGLLSFAPLLMKLLSVAGTIAMFLVGGSILIHGIAPVEELIHHLEEWVNQLTIGGAFLAVVSAMIAEALFGIVAGGVVLLLVNSIQKILPKKQKISKAD
ncbi:DUF808 domain-containing protein [Aliikangiella sp. G2MR2-5]|uniref:DUF808 domain-containing protein n=1 Tax=Aliikangiella sp. G2MR2-5 TaxID=2788943 RepID=UPI0018AB6B42|nr:DUF808 domain-containing protein [Aliikangiella sp. G2MR2-5]